MKSALVLILAAAVYAQQPPGKAVNFYSLEREAELGRKASAALDGFRIHNAALNAYVAALGAAVAQSADPRFHYTFAFYDCRQPGVTPASLFAFPTDGTTAEPLALAGGPILVPLGLLAQAPSEAAFAFQLAHAIPHVALRHATRNMTRVQLIDIGTIPLRNVAARGASQPALRQGIELGMSMAMLQFARAQEREADSLAVTLVASAGYDPLAAVPVVESAPELERRAFSSHPSAADRAAAIRGAAANLNPQPYTANTGQFDLMKALSSAVSQSAK